MLSERKVGKKKVQSMLIIKKQKGQKQGKQIGMAGRVSGVEGGKTARP